MSLNLKKAQETGNTLFIQIIYFFIRLIKDRPC